MTNPRKPQTWMFPCYQWLSLYESDCQVRRSLKPLVHKKAEKVGKYKLEKEDSFRVVDNVSVHATYCLVLGVKYSTVRSSC